MCQWIYTLSRFNREVRTAYNLGTKCHKVIVIATRFNFICPRIIVYALMLLELEYPYAEIVFPLPASDVHANITCSWRHLLDNLNKCLSTNRHFSRVISFSSCRQVIYRKHCKQPDKKICTAWRVYHVIHFD